MAALTEPDREIAASIGVRARALRSARGQTLDALAAETGVSRAMLSRIERSESSPTAGLLAKLCDGLGVSLAAFLGGEPVRPDPPLARAADQPVWRDPASGYLRRAVSPAGAGSRVEIAEVELPVGAAVLLDPLDGAGRDQHVWVLAGALEIGHGGAMLLLARGDCLRLASGGPTRFRNAGPELARYAVITGRAGRPEPPAPAPSPGSGGRQGAKGSAIPS